jgi:hypothetical protein
VLEVLPHFSNAPSARLRQRLIQLRGKLSDEGREDEIGGRAYGSHRQQLDWQLDEWELNDGDFVERFVRDQLRNGDRELAVKKADLLPDNRFSALVLELLASDDANDVKNAMRLLKGASFRSLDETVYLSIVNGPLLAEDSDTQVLALDAMFTHDPWYYQKVIHSLAEKRALLSPAAKQRLDELSVERDFELTIP